MKEFFKKIIYNSSSVSSKISVNSSNVKSNYNHDTSSIDYNTKDNGIKKIDSYVKTQNESDKLRYLIDSSSTHYDIFKSIVRKGKQVQENLFPDSINNR